MENLIQKWLEAKEAEDKWKAYRREIEDQILAQVNLPEDFEGVHTVEAAGGKLKLTGRISEKVDAAKLRELAIEHGLSEHLDALFRWKAEVSKKSWKAADAAITAPLMGAITAKPGRTSFAFSKEERDG